MQLKFCLIALASIFCGAALGLAQNEPRPISVRTMAMNSIESDTLFFASSGDEKWVEVNWSQRQPSKPVETFTNRGVLSLFSEDTDPKAKSPYKIAHQVKITPGAKEILLFGLMKDDKLQLLPIVDDFLGAKYDRWLMINFSSREIAFRVGSDSKPILLKSKDSKIYKISVAENTGATVLGQAKIRGSEPKTFYSSYYPVKKGRRTMVFFADDGDRIITRFVVDHFPRKKKPAQ